VQLKVGFASEQHARAALRFLAGSSLHVTAATRPGTSDGDMAVVDIEIPNDEWSRLETLLVGVHGIVLREPQAVLTVVA
jgi:hypothetical protein